jgi:UDP-N-acetylglucosamine 2-epimerase (non-hydrolysing)
VWSLCGERPICSPAASGRLAGAAALDAVDARVRPDLVVVQGDTTTVFCAAPAAFYHRIPVAHVAAGLRTGALRAPWPEEADRVLTTRPAALHFRHRRLVPDPGAAAGPGRPRPRRAAPRRRRAASRGLITAHRREDFGPRSGEAQFVYPVHPNPNVQATVRAVLADPEDPRLRAGNVHLVEPLATPSSSPRRAPAP